MRFGWPLALLLSVALLLDASPLLARGRERIAIIGVAASSALGRQLHIELTTLGYDVLLLEPTASSTTEQLEAAGREPDMKAAICVGSAERGDVEVWLRSGPGTLTLHSVETTHAEPRVTALRSAERLRASLFELPAEPAMAKPRATAPVPVEPARGADSATFARPLDAPTWVLGLGGATLVSPGGLGRVLSLTPSVEAWFHDNWGAALRAFLPLSESRITGPEGSTTIAITLVALGPSLRVRPAATRWQLDAQLACGVALLDMQGSAEPPFESHDVLASSAGVMGSLAVGYRLSRAFRLSSGVLLGSLFPEAEVRFDERAAASFGGLYGGATVSLHAELD